MKKILTFMSVVLAAVLAFPANVWAAGSGGSGVALYSFCRTSSVHSSNAACKRRMVGSPSAADGRILDRGHGASVYRSIRSRKNSGNSAGMHGQ